MYRIYAISKRKTNYKYIHILYTYIHIYIYVPDVSPLLRYPFAIPSIPYNDYDYLACFQSVIDTEKHFLITIFTLIPFFC